MKSSCVLIAGEYLTGPLFQSTGECITVSTVKSEGVTDAGGGTVVDPDAGGGDCGTVFDSDWGGGGCDTVVDPDAAGVDCNTVFDSDSAGVDADTGKLARNTTLIFPPNQDRDLLGLKLLFMYISNNVCDTVSFLGGNPPHVHLSKFY
jgi:hypothetical protein